MCRVRGPAILLIAALAAPVTVAGRQVPAAVDAGVTVARIGAYVERYYTRTQSIVAQETVTMQPLRSDLSFEGFARRLVYDLRVEWDPTSRDGDSSARVIRELVKASGPALGPPDQPDCLDPRGISPEPLAFLLPERVAKYRWRTVGSARVGGRSTVMVEYRPIAAEPPKVVWDKECAWIDLPGRTAGRVWADSETAEVMRFDEHLVGMVDIPAPRNRPARVGQSMSFTIERSDTSIRYKPVTFTDPDETLLLPSEITSLTIIRNSGMPRLRTTQSFTNYRRFVTDSRLVFE